MARGVRYDTTYLLDEPVFFVCARSAISSLHVFVALALAVQGLGRSCLSSSSTDPSEANKLLIVLPPLGQRVIIEHKLSTPVFNNAHPFGLFVLC